MAHRYHESITVHINRDGNPKAFTWRNLTYEPLQILSSWHLRDRWWEQDQGRASNRLYYRVMTPDHQVFEL